MRRIKIITTGPWAKFLLYRTSVVICCFALTAVLLACVMTVSALRERTTASETVTGKTLIIDAGHGGFDGGAVVGNDVEKDINLAIALYLSDMLKLNGYQVIMTRSDDSSTESDPNATIARRKVSDLKNRLALMREHPEATFVSVHLNKYESSGVWGAQVFYASGVTGSKELAEAVMKSLVTQVQPENKRQIKPHYNSTFILKNSPIPAIIAECGFMSNPKELSLLKTEDYQKKIAFAIFCGITEYFA